MTTSRIYCCDVTWCVHDPVWPERLFNELVSVGGRFCCCVKSSECDEEHQHGLVTTGHLDLWPLYTCRSLSMTFKCAFICQWAVTCLCSLVLLYIWVTRSEVCDVSSTELPQDDCGSYILHSVTRCSSRFWHPYTVVWLSASLLRKWTFLHKTLTSAPSDTWSRTGSAAPVLDLTQGLTAADCLHMFNSYMWRTYIHTCVVMYVCVPDDCEYLIAFIDPTKI